MSPTAPARRPAAGRAAPKADPAADPRVVVAYISLTPPAPVTRPPSSRTIAQLREKAEVAARNAAAAQTLLAQVQRAFKPPPGKLFAVDVTGLLLIGPGGALGTTTRMAQTLAPLAAGGRHPVAVLMAAGGWQDDQALREALVGIGGKLAALGLRICRRKAGLRIAKLKAA